MIAAGILQIGKKILLKLVFVVPVDFQISREIGIVGKCEGVCGIMDKLSQRVIIDQTEFIPPFKAFGNTLYISLRGFPIVPPQPLTADRAFKIGCGIFVRFGTAQQERPDIAFGRIAEISLRQIQAELTVRFCFDGKHRLS